MKSGAQTTSVYCYWYCTVALLHAHPGHVGEKQASEKLTMTMMTTVFFFCVVDFSCGCLTTNNKYVQCMFPAVPPSLLFI